MAYNTDISNVVDGEDASATILNRPHDKLLANTNYLKTTLEVEHNTDGTHSTIASLTATTGTITTLNSTTGTITTLNSTTGTITTLTTTTGTITKVKAGDGEVGAPAIVFANDTDLGFYRIGADNLGLAITSVKRYDFGVAFTMTLNGNFVVNQNSVDVITSENTGGIVNTLYLKQGHAGILNSQPHNYKASESDLVVGKGTVGSGITIVSGDSYTSAITVAEGTTSILNSRGSIKFNHPYNYWTFEITNTEYLRMTYNQSLSTGGESSPDVDMGGICLHHGSSDGNVLTFKNSDVAHGITDFAETDTYALFKKGAGQGAIYGGLAISGFSEDRDPIRIFGYATTEVTSTNSSSTGCVEITAYKKSGTGVTNLDTGYPGGNLFIIRNNTFTRFIIKGDGDVYNNGGSTSMGTYDTYQDAVAMRDFSYILGGKEHFEKILQYHINDFEQMGVIRHDKITGDIMVSLNAWRGLTAGAIGELHGVLELALKKSGMDYDSLRKEFRQNQLLGA